MAIAEGSSIFPSGLILDRTMPQLKSLALTFVSLVASVVSGSFSAVLAQATATGSLTFYQPADPGLGTPEILYSIGGQITTPTGLQFQGPLTITPGASDSRPFGITNPDPNLANIAVPNSLTINPGAVIASPLTTQNQQIANILNNLVLPNDLAEIVSIIRASGSIADNAQQASVSGAVTYSNGSLLQTISGEIALQFGYYPGPLYIEPSFGNAGDPNSAAYPLSNGIISSLVISPGAPIFNATPATINAAAAAQLNNANTLEQQVSIVRAGQSLFAEGSPNQSRATGSTSIVVIDPASSAFGFTQSASGEVALPNNLFYFGPPVESRLPVGNPNNCQPGSGCLFIASVANNLLAPGVPQLNQLIVDPGTASQSVANLFNFNAQAASLLLNAPDLQSFVSILRAGTSASGPYENALQARASGSVTIASPNGTTQSASGELSLSPGLYFERPALDADCKNSAGPSGCLAVTADIQLANAGATDFADTAFINQLLVDPGDVQPGDPLNPTGLLPYNFNAAAAFELYRAIDNGNPLEDIVARIRAGAGAGGLVSPNQPTTRAAGSVALTLPNGAVQTTTGEVSLPAGLAYTGSTVTGCLTGGCLAVNPNLINIYLGNGGSNPNLLTSSFLNIDPGLVSGATKVWNFDAAAAYGLTQQTTLEGQTSVIRAVAGDKGLPD